MKLIRNIKRWLVLPLLVIISGCNNNDGPRIDVELQNEVNEFVWFAMRDYYLWNAEVEDLSNNKYPTYNALYTFLNEYDQPETLFDDLLFEEDRFSWIVDDYEELEDSFQGISKSFGYELGLVRFSSGSDNLYAYIKYVVPGGPAENAGLQRGDLFTRVGGTQLTIDNYLSLLFDNENITIGLAQIQDGTLSNTDEEVSLTAIELSENRVLLSDVLEIDGAKVGYLVYNQFVNNDTYHAELNNIFSGFKTEGINDLVLDLRYNGGGSVRTSAMLASLIYGAGGTDDIFTVSQYNQGLENLLLSNGFDLNDYFTDVTPNTNTVLNRLNISRIFILTSGSTASASELVISGLDPYMDVTLIGTKTVGKNVGSQTFYHSPNFEKTPEGSNVNHTLSKYAIQPIISRFTNINNIDYLNGFTPNIEVNEIDYLEDFKPLGDPTEPLLAEALGIITGVARLERRTDSGRETIDLGVNDLTRTILIDSEKLPKFTLGQFPNAQ